MAQVSSFSPVIDKNALVLILGSMPGVESLDKQQYYANPRNQFWKIVFALFDSLVEEDYEKRLSFLNSKRIAIWDVIANCYREGSLDSNIRDEEVNDFDWLFEEYPNIKYVVFNGAKAYESFRKRVGFASFSQVIFTKMTSTSPANTISFENKLKEWKVVREYLQ